ncbi:MAG: NYN domain-containing protein [Candidatus Altiarchaeales archaeon]|nr:NYN domain-containing protein [Candidatus Altiarchaeales archaeon]
MKQGFFHRNQRTGVFVDVQNMYYSAMHLYDSKVDFNKILRDAVAKRTLIRAFAYVIKADVKEEESFFDALESIGFEVKSKDLQVFWGGHKKGDWDVGIAMDAIREAPKLDTIVLVSGDGDFTELVKYLKGRGCRVEVMAFKKSASSKLIEEADYFHNLDKDKKYLRKKQNPRKRRQKTQKK